MEDAITVLTPKAKRFSIRLSLTLKALRWYIPNHDLSIVIRLNLHPFFCESQYRGLDRVHVITPRNTFPPCHFIPWLQSFTHRCSFQYTYHLPATGHTRPTQDQTLPVYFPGKIRHGGHIATVGTPDVLQDTLLEV